MLKKIQLHLESDEKKQVELEQNYSKIFAHNSQENLNAFNRYMPSLAGVVSGAQSKNISLFVNKFNKPNVVDYGLGRVFYGFNPERECQIQVEQFIQHPLIIELDNHSHEHSTEDNIWQQMDCYFARKPLTTGTDTVVVLGLGLGYHLLELIEKTQCKHVIVYEPEIQYFSCSISAINWRKIFDYARLNHIGIYLQLGKDGRNIIQDVDELQQHANIREFSILKHYNHPVFDSIERAMKGSSWEQLHSQGINFSLEYKNAEYRSPFSPQICRSTLTPVTTKSDLFESNIQSFQKYFPDIAKEFEDYQPKSWYAVRNKIGQINLIQEHSLDTFHGDEPKHESEIQFDNYALSPHKDGLVLGYTGTKLKHYLHYQFVNESESFLDELQEDEGALEQRIKSIIVFGIGTGYQLQSMSDGHEIEKLFLCEPNRDYFYASLYAIDWSEILTKIDEANGRVYINIGDDGSNLFRDLLNQFYAVGPYNLANTYFYQSYYNTALNNSIAQLREQLQVVISMGEYFDHAYFGISHTVEGLDRGYSHLVKQPSQCFDLDQSEIPVFIVGNGPSLDSTIDEIKENYKRVIIVSCGTSLQVLHRHGIVPDYHAEIEQNRSTHDWATRLKDKDYLKQITLVSCNGVHPDTCDLYKNVLVAFKEGESSTVSSLNILGENNFETLKFAFPTVSNLAVNLFVTLGFKQLYFFGIDLGFIDKNHHHSKSSGYYDEKGKQLYDYSEKNNTGLIVPGNFVATVNTKHEFKVSRVVMEDLLRGYSGDCFNTSNGAKILGSTPLKPEFLLVTSSPELKSTVTNIIETKAFVPFSSMHKGRFSDVFFSKYSQQQLELELDRLLDELQNEITDIAQAEALIETQKNLLFTSYKSGSSLLFYYLYGTSNYANALFSKILSYSRKKRFFEFNRARESWAKHLTKMSSRVKQNVRHFDITSSLGYLREKALLAGNKQHKYVVFCEDDRFQKAFEVACGQYILEDCFSYIRHSDVVSGKVSIPENMDIAILVENGQKTFVQNFCTDLQCNSVLVIRESQWGFDVEREIYPTLIYKDNFLQDNAAWNSNAVHIANLAILYARMSNKLRVLLPKYSIVEKSEIEKYISEEVCDESIVYDFGRILALSTESLEKDDLLTDTSTRGIMLVPPYLSSEYVSAYITKAQQDTNRLQVLEAYPFLKVINHVS